jgi:glucose-6-phosphate isomerase
MSQKEKAATAAGFFEHAPGGSINRQTLSLGTEGVIAQEEGRSMAESAVGAASFQTTRLRPAIEKLEADRFTERLWKKDGTLWAQDEAVARAAASAMGWLDAPVRMQAQAAELMAFAREAKAAGFTRVVHMGMGGSSLAPCVFRQMFAPGAHGLPLTVLDTTDPAIIAALDRKLDMERTLFIVASKSGTTAEPAAFEDYFFDRVRTLKASRAGENFVAVTDPGSPLAESARQKGFRRVFWGFADVGGRYSAISNFGLLPAALLGLDVERLLADAMRMVEGCGPSVPVCDNPAAVLGAVMGEMAASGRDKVTFLLPDDLSTLGMWLEQLIAESTGKNGTGIVPVAGEPEGAPLVYGNDRLFVHIYVKGRSHERMETAVAAIQAANLPIVFIELADNRSICQEFFRWEVATAVAGAILGINPFDQPNVQESKDATNRILQSVKERGSLTEPAPVLSHGPLGFFVRDGGESAEELLWSFLSQGRPGDYVAFQAYLPEETATNNTFQAMRRRLRDDLGFAATLGYGPRFLHSTGQLHKGGPNTGLFIQLTCRDAVDISIPGRPYTFGVFKKAQALGDLEALIRHGRRVMRIDLGDNVKKGLAHLVRLLDRALAIGAEEGA